MGYERAAAPLGQPIIPFAVTILQASAKPLPLSGVVMAAMDGHQSQKTPCGGIVVTLVVEASRAALSEDHSVTEFAALAKKQSFRGGGDDTDLPQ
jgi:hypothetical protein